MSAPLDKSLAWLADGRALAQELTDIYTHAKAWIEQATDAGYPAALDAGTYTREPNTGLDTTLAAAAVGLATALRDTLDAPGANGAPSGRAILHLFAALPSQ